MDSNTITHQFPEQFRTIGQRIEYLSSDLLPNGRFKEYQDLIGTIFDEKIHYIDPVHELKGKDAVLKMLAKYVPRAANDQFKFQLIHDGENFVIWSWTISLKIKFTWFQMKINGLVHAKIKNDKIVYQREFYDPMESIEVIPIFGKLYKFFLRVA